MSDLVKSGIERIEWVRRFMPVLSQLRDEFAPEKPLEGLRLAMSIHLEAKTAYLALCLHDLGAQIVASGSNPLSTRDDIVAALRSKGLLVNAAYNESDEEYEANLRKTLAFKPNVVLDDGGDLLRVMGEEPEYASAMIGGCEETTTGILRIKRLEREGRLMFPMIDVNGATMKHLFDNRYGTGQSVTDAITRTTNLVLASKVVVVAGYGWCGRGIAMRMKGMGARVIVTEIDAAKACEAKMDGFDVMSMDDAAALGDLFVTATGCEDVVTTRHFDKIRSGAILCNAGHFDVEVNVHALAAAAVEKRRARDNIDEYVMADGRKLYVLGEGRLVNLAAGDGHPAEIMDLSFSIQLMCIKYMWEHRDMEKKLHSVPAEIDERVARLKLAAMGCQIDELTPQQHEYLYGV